MSESAGAFEEVRIVDNFYQTSCFYPMPVVLVSTLAESGQTNLGPYSLCFPHVVSGKHAMMLIARGNSNTANNIRRTGRAALNFIPDERRLLDNCVVLGFPGESTQEKMKDSVFTLIRSPSESTQEGPLPQLVGEAVQVLECRWDASHPHEVNGLEHHYLLEIEHIYMPGTWKKALLEGGTFPRLPIDYGYRDSVHFWFSHGSKPYAVDVPKGRGSTAEAIQFDANRIDPEVQWELSACAELVNVPRIFLKTVLTGCVEAAKAQGRTTLTAEFLRALRDQRKGERPAGLLQKIQRFLARPIG